MEKGLFIKSCVHRQWRSGYESSSQPEGTGFIFCYGPSFSLLPFFSFLFCFVLFAYLFCFFLVLFVFKYIPK